MIQKIYMCSFVYGWSKNVYGRTIYFTDKYNWFLWAFKKLTFSYLLFLRQGSSRAISNMHHYMLWRSIFWLNRKFMILVILTKVVVVVQHDYWCDIRGEHERGKEKSNLPENCTVVIHHHNIFIK